MSGRPSGTILTFYSYNGGTGRSMALANIAWILASCGQRVLAVDWDLEAPGLHRYFRPFLLDKDLGSSTGVIDFVIEYAAEAIKPEPPNEPLPDDWYVEQADILRHAISLDWEFPSGGLLDFIPAGKQNATYAARVNSFDWQNFYDRLGGGQVLNAAAVHMRADYDYVLIDSRTGVSDTAGICTVQLPDALAVCFTYNNQSIEGAAAVARSVHEQRLKRGDRNFKIFPLPMRVDPAEVDKLNARRRYSWEVFDPLIGHIASANRRSYWGEVEVPYVPIFAYEEVLASFREEPSDPKTTLSAMLRAAVHLTGLGSDYSFPIAPAKRQEILADFASTPGQEASPVASLSGSERETPAEELQRRAESVFGAASAEEQRQLRTIFGRLVRVAGSPEEAASGFRKLRVRLQDLGAEALVRRLVDAGLLTSTRDQVGEEILELAEENLVESWPRLHVWITQDLDFLSWRQKLRELIRDWEANGRKSDFLLRGLPLRTARGWLGERSADISGTETAFINQSSILEQRSPDLRVGGGRAFVIRPFGTKQGINFDEVAKTLIDPALTALGLKGRETIEILEQGNLRIDMFQRLLTADLIVADLSIHNANVFYELGIRHALRAKRTFLLRSDQNAYPFDLQSDRYFSYRKDAPAASLMELTDALRRALTSEDQDSPVFRSLPNLEEQNRSRFLAVPRGFREEVELAAASKRVGDLRLLAAEAEGFEWESEGMRIIGRAQFDLRDYMGARSTWETIRQVDPEDLEANTILATVFQRVGDVTHSDQAAQQVLAQKGLPPTARAEANAFLGRNSKARWENEWIGGQADPVPVRKEKALRSPFLEESYDAYRLGFAADLNHFNSGLNALAMLTIQLELARALPAVWDERFELEREAAADLAGRQAQREKLAAAVDLSLAAAQARLRHEEKRDIWVEISIADLFCLTSQRPPRVADAYRKALADVPDFAVGAVRDQLRLYQRLEIMAANVQAALAVAAGPSQPDSEEHGAPPPRTSRILLFTGHMIDVPQRTSPRFPPDREDVARLAIRRAIESELKRPGGVAGGIAGGASGGDILFHEICADVGIPTQLFLALPRSQFIAESVAPAGGNWRERFDRLFDKLPSRVLAESKELPSWLAKKPNYDLRQRNNLWTLYNALAQGGEDVTLIALWNGEKGDDPGSTGDLVMRAKERHAATVILDTRSIFDLGPARS